MEISITFKQPKPGYDCDNAFVDVAITGLRVQQVHRICERMPDVIAHAYFKSPPSVERYFGVTGDAPDSWY